MTTRPSRAQDLQTCLSEDVILAFQLGETTDAERACIHEHVDVCEHCRGLVLLAAGLDRVMEGDAGTESSSERLASAFMAGGFSWRAFADGKRLANRFNILRFVERGGMGEVYEAFDTVVGSRVALKTLLVTTADTSQALHRLSQEVNLARRVAHPHVCRIYDLHEHAERGERPMRFLAMEFVAGETLKDRLLAAELTLAEACLIARQLLQGLGAVHAAGVLHLDFKSQNVMLRSGLTSAQAVVMDFSLSRAFEKELRLRTSERQLAGSIGYMSPEQLECRPTLGPASDVYAFGVVLFEMLTRRMPFEGESPTSIMLKQLSSSPAPPSSLRPEIGVALDELVLTCLRRQPGARFQTVEAVLNELERCMRLQEAPPSKTPRRRGIALACVLVAALAALGNSVRRQASEAVAAAAPLRAETRPASVSSVPSSARPPEPALEAKPPSVANPGTPRSVKVSRTAPRLSERRKRAAKEAVVPPATSRERAATPEAPRQAWRQTRAPGFLLDGSEAPAIAQPRRRER